MNDLSTALRSGARQEQFLEVVDRDEATARFQRHLRMRPLGAEAVPLSQALGRVLARTVVLVIGGTGPGACDHAAAALAEAGDLAIHGIALRPGETAGVGHTRNAVPVLLLPGAPAACLFAHEMVAGRAIRRLGGRDPALPYRSRVIGRR